MTAPKAYLVKMRAMTDDEKVALGWEHTLAHDRGVVVELSDGTRLIASQDPEGNGPGFLFVGLPNGEVAYPKLQEEL